MKQSTNATNAYSNAKGESSMFEEVIMERAKMEAEARYAPLLDALDDRIEQLSSLIDQLSFHINYLENLLKQHNIQFE